MQLLPKLIDQYNATHLAAPLARIRLHDSRHVHATTLLLLASRSMWWRLGWAMLTRAPL